MESLDGDTYSYTHIRTHARGHTHAHSLTVETKEREGAHEAFEAVVVPACARVDT